MMSLSTSISSKFILALLVHRCLQCFDAIGWDAEWWDAGIDTCLGRGADLHMAQLMPLPLTISCSSEFILVLPSWFYLFGTGSRV